MGDGLDMAIWSATALGAVSLYLLMPRRGLSSAGSGAARGVGGLLGAMVLGGLWLYLARLLPAGADPARTVYYYLFSAIAIVSAVRVITHTKPVFSALWFVMVILASAGLLLLLGAEFMAFAMVIIYAGAILVTYMFVIMLAAQAGDPASSQEQPEYERAAREPMAATAAGFLLLAVLLTLAFGPEVRPNPRAAGPGDAEMIATVLTDRAAGKLAAGQRRSGAEAPEAPGAPGALGALGDPGLDAGAVTAEAVTPTGPFADDASRLDNAERVGVDLFRSHPLGLELAGVILLVSLIGAVVIARQRVQT